MLHLSYYIKARINVIMRANIAKLITNVNHLTNNNYDCLI